MLLMYNIYYHVDLCLILINLPLNVHVSGIIETKANKDALCQKLYQEFCDISKSRHLNNYAKYHI